MAPPRLALLLFLAALCASPGPAVEVSASLPTTATTGRLLRQATSPQRQSLALLAPSRPLLAGRVAIMPTAAASGGRYNGPYESDVESYVVERGGGRRGRGSGVVAKSAVDAPPALPPAAAASSSSSSPLSPSPSPSPSQAPAPSVIFLPPAPPAASRLGSRRSSSRKLLQNTRLETSLALASDLTGPISPATGSALGWAGAAVPKLRSEGRLGGLGAKGGCTACVVSIENAGPLATQTRDLNNGVATLNNLASMYRTYYLTALERRNG